MQLEGQLLEIQGKVEELTLVQTALAGIKSEIRQAWKDGGNRHVVCQLWGQRRGLVRKSNKLVAEIGELKRVYFPSSVMYRQLRKSLLSTRA